jgi:hypothetical protein
MARMVLLWLGAGAAVLAVAGWRLAQSSPPETLTETKARPPEAAPLCPWREPQTDLPQLFPTATRYELETRILSGQRLELAQRLRRMPTGDENALHICSVYRGQTPLGTIVTRRVKGAYGAIELVLAADTSHRLCGLLLQRLREPEPIARALQDPEWLRSFHGKGPDAPWQLGNDIPDVLHEARPSAQAVVEGARSTLILLAAADQAPPIPGADAHHQ